MNGPQKESPLKRFSAPFLVEKRILFVFFSEISTFRFRYAAILLRRDRKSAESSAKNGKKRPALFRGEPLFLIGYSFIPTR